MLRCSCSAVASYLGFGTLQFSGSLRANDPFLGALYPSKSGLTRQTYRETYREVRTNTQMNKRIVKNSTYRETCRDNGDMLQEISDRSRTVFGVSRQKGLHHQIVVDGGSPDNG
jgi:hypothetical protein